LLSGFHRDLKAALAKSAADLVVEYTPAGQGMLQQLPAPRRFPFIHHFLR
jgi:hypothetical protein